MLSEGALPFAREDFGAGRNSLRVSAGNAACSLAFSSAQSNHQRPVRCCAGHGGKGKEIFALPGRVTDPLSQGCNRLIVEGAHPLLSAEQVLDSLGIFYEKRKIAAGKAQKGLAKMEKMVYSCLDSEPRHLEEIALRAGISVGQAAGILLDLELSGCAVRIGGSYYEAVGQEDE